MIYLSYDNYKSLGGDIDEIQYPILERLARKKLDNWTLNRISEIKDITDDIRLAMFLIINQLKDGKKEEKEIASVSNDGVSITYSNSSKTSEQKENELYEKIIEILPLELISICVN